MLQAMVLCLVAGGPAATDARTTAVLAQGRAAIAGESSPAVQALSVRASFRRSPLPRPEGADAASPRAEGAERRPPWMGQQQAEGDLSLDVLLPDKVRREETLAFPGRPPITIVAGADGDAGWFRTEGTPFGRGFGGGRVPGGPGGFGGPDGMGPRRGPGRPGEEGAGPDERRLSPEERRAAAARRLHAETSRILLGVLLDAPGDEASFKFAGEAEAPDGKADVLDVTTASGLTGRLFLDASTHLPLMLTYEETPPRRRLRRSEAAASPSGDVAEAPSPSPALPGRKVEVTLYFADHRPAGGLQLPFSIRRAVDGHVVEEWEIKKWTVNPSLKPDRFREK